MLDRLNQALDHIESHLDQPIDVADLARIALTSEYHFRRMFSALSGMPLSEYVRRRRLTVAAAEVLEGGTSLLDVAIRYGYGSGEAFARAFRAVHGVGPGEVRRVGASLQSQPRMSFRLTVEGSSSMRYRVVEKDVFRIVGRRARVPLVFEGLNPAVTTFICSIEPSTLSQIKALSDQEPAGVVSVSDNIVDRTREGTEYDYFLGVVTGKPVPEGLDAIDVAAGSWAVFDSDGEFPAAVQNLWRDVFTQWFPANPYRSRQGPEILRTHISEDGSTAEAELWIPVERALP
ncbi:MAG: AraC family transcriptional regulator [Frankiaceae bacterium]|nr:AraC family transcriptional regulator [Frankiaceae bacterium]